MRFRMLYIRLPLIWPGVSCYSTIVFCAYTWHQHFRLVTWSLNHFIKKNYFLSFFFRSSSLSPVELLFLLFLSFFACEWIIYRNGCIDHNVGDTLTVKFPAFDRLRRAKKTYNKQTHKMQDRLLEWVKSTDFGQSDVGNALENKTNAQMQKLCIQKNSAQRAKYYIHLWMSWNCVVHIGLKIYCSVLLRFENLRQRWIGRPILLGICSVLLPAIRYLCVRLVQLVLIIVCFKTPTCTKAKPSQAKVATAHYVFNVQTHTHTQKRIRLANNLWVNEQHACLVVGFYN